MFRFVLDVFYYVYFYAGVVEATGNNLKYGFGNLDQQGTQTRSMSRLDYLSGTLDMPTQKLD